MFQKKIPWVKLTAAFLAGAVVGAATALLFAPTTGRKLQKQIANVVDEQVESVEKIVKKMVA